MSPKISNRLSSWLLLISGCMFLAGCQSKYERLPKATQKELQALSERYQAFVEEAKKLKPGDEFHLLHHFSHAALTQVKPEAFTNAAKEFISKASSGGLDNIKIIGARSPGKVRVLLIKTADGKGVIPFVQTSDGWKIDEVGSAFGDYTTEVNLKGNMPAQQPSILASMVVLQDQQASETDVVQAAIELASSNDKATAQKFAAAAKKPWAKTALLYAAWKTGADCEPFANAFPIDGESQGKLYDADTESFRTLLSGLCQCAAESKSSKIALKVYKGCYNVEGGARSEYVDQVVEMANKQPEYILAAAMRTNYKYEMDPVANIMVGAIHGEKKMPFYQFIHKKAKEGGRAGKLAQEWVDKMSKRDVAEPPGTENGDKPAE
jgi:hypothetical protein